MFSKLVRLFIQFLILLFILALVMAGLNVLSTAPKFNDLYFFIRWHHPIFNIVLGFNLHDPRAFKMPSGEMVLLRKESNA